MDFKDITRHALYFHTVLLILFLFSGGCTSQFVTKEPTLQDALDASASDLALSYLYMKHTVRFVAIGERATVTIGNVTINKDNVDEYKAKYKGRLSIYEQAIRQRGFMDLSGIYTGEAAESCSRSNSIFAAIIQQQKHEGIEIRQNDMNALLVISVLHDESEIDVNNTAAVVESAIAVNEAANSDYYFRGEFKNEVIILKPDVMVLKTWPKWANPPSRKDLENCQIRLERRWLSK